MLHPLILGSGGPLASPRCQVSEKKSTGYEDTISMEIQVPAIKDLDLAHGLDVRNVQDDTAVEDSVSCSSRREEVIDNVSTVRKDIHEDPFAEMWNDAESSVYDNIVIEVIDVAQVESGHVD